MIRIDEIYNNTFWPFIKKHVPLTRMFFCDPPGNTDPKSLGNHGSDIEFESNYIFFHDQEPIHLDIHKPLFDEVIYRNEDINWYYEPNFAALVTSEQHSDAVHEVCSQYNWQPYYYFFHGWAALDWYRGYDKTFLITTPEQRNITKTFIAPNRIVAGKRQHRLQLLYYIFKLGLTDNWISCPEVCPAENMSIYDAIRPLQCRLPDIESVFRRQALPLVFPGESNHPMHSCWLSLFDQAETSLLYLVTETVATGRRYHLTEKTFKPIAQAMPFVLVGTAGSLKYLRTYGFQTFGEFWDESYDDEIDDDRRIEKIALLLEDLDTLSTKEKNDLFHSMHAVIQHNWDHFYKGGFEQILWKELQDMLMSLSHDSMI